MTKGARSLALVVALSSSCGPAVPSAAPALLKPAAPRPLSSTGEVDAMAELPALDASRIALGPTAPSPLEVATILAVWGDDSALFVSQFAGEHPTFLQRVDGAHGALGPVVSLTDEYVFGAFARGTDLTVASTHMATICLTTYRGSAIVSRGCEAKQGTVLLPLDDHFVLLSAKPPDPDAKPPTGKDAAKNKKVGEPAQVKPKSSIRAKAIKKRPKARPEPKVAADPRKLSLDRQLLTADGALDGETGGSGLVFTAPMAGMELVAGSSNGTRARALYYEWAGSVKNAKTGVLGRARLALGSLDATGTYDETSRSQLPETDLMFGYLAEHQEPRLLTTKRGALYLGVASPHGKCEATVVSPFSMPLIPDDALCALDPGGYFDVADRVRAAQKAGTSVGRTGFPAPKLAAAAFVKARRTYAQGETDPMRTAAWSDRGYAMSGDDALTFTSIDAPTALPRPLVAERSRIAWGAFAPDGSGIAALEHGLVRVDQRGTTTLDAIATVHPSLLLRADVEEGTRRSAAKVGGRWWQSRGELRALEGPEGARSKALRLLPPDSAVLVGGAESGLVIETASGALRVERFDPKSGISTPVGRTRTPVMVGFDAVERHAGGAIVAGPSTTSLQRIVAFAIDASGHISPPIDTGLTSDPASHGVRLTALPAGGALLTDEARREIVWLSDAAKPLGKTAWTGGESDAHCIDGRPARLLVPSREPGRLVSFPSFARPGTCITGDLSWASDGSLRWFGSTASGPHTRAELGRVETATTQSVPSSGTEPVFTALDAPAQAPCPSDMVSIRGRFCVDRFEDTLAERSTGELLSPDVASTPNLLSVAMGEWSTRRERVGDLFARALPLPRVSPSQLGRTIDVVAVSRMGIRPSGYVTGLVAKSACEGSGKRLCSLDEWKTACRGEADTLFPYGPDYEDGVCNVNREAHPAALLHGHSSLGHLDPRLNHAAANGSPLFHTTAESPRCVSRWGTDGVFDMVGNLDEWIDEGGGAFAGGFYARGTKSGCAALVDNHPASYLDYSTGIRCCKSASL